MITFGIPSFNRAAYLAPLIESIFKCNLNEFEVLVVEDCSPERVLIEIEINKLQDRFSSNTKTIRYVENESNLGYDKNLKKIVNEALGEYIIFIGNDDLVQPEQMTAYANEILSKTDVSVFLRGYRTFDDVHGEVSRTQIVSKSRYAIKYNDINQIYRFSGIISGFAVKKAFAKYAETTELDGGLFYQIYLVFSAYSHSKVFLSETIPVLCRRDIPPDFGSSSNETSFIVGEYDLAARIHMARAQLDIGEHFRKQHPDGFMDMYKKAMSVNIAPHLIELQRLKWKNMTKMYLFLFGCGVGRNLKSFIIYVVLIMCSKSRASKILNKVSNLFHLSRS